MFLGLCLFRLDCRCRIYVNGLLILNSFVVLLYLVLLMLIVLGSEFVVLVSLRINGIDI